MRKVLDLKSLEKLRWQIREEILEMVWQAKSGHLAGSLGVVEQYLILFLAGILNYKPEEPNWPARDRLVISNGHYAPALYAVMAEAGFFKKEELLTLRKFGSRLQGHPSRNHLPGIETSSGPLGEGLSQSIGLALAAKLNQEKWQVFCGMSDGEQDCGNTWEAVMLAGKLKLPNLIAFIDRNEIQIDGFTEEVMPLALLREKYQSFSWHVLEGKGNDLEEVKEKFEEAKEIPKPVVIIFRTIPGYGVDFMQWKSEWHGKVPNEKEYQSAISQIRKKLEKI